MTAEFVVGEIVDITIRGARIHAVHGDPDTNALTIGIEHAASWTTAVPMVDSVTVERVAPPEWPPQAGDLWRDRRGLLWFARELTDDDDEPVVDLVSVDHVNLYQPVEQQFGPMAMVRREQPDGGER